MDAAAACPPSLPSTATADPTAPSSNPAPPTRPTQTSCRKSASSTTIPPPKKTSIAPWPASSPPPPPTASPPAAPPLSPTSPNSHPRRAATLGSHAQLLLPSKGSKHARQDSNNLSHALLKTLDLAYNPKYGKLNPAFKEAASSFAQDQSQSPTQPPQPPNHRSGHPRKDGHPEPA